MKKKFYSTILLALFLLCITTPLFAEEAKPDKGSQEAFSMYESGTKALESGRLKQGEKRYKEAIKLEANNPLYHNELGYVYYLQRKFDKAIEEYNKAIELKPDYSTAYNNLGGAYDEIGEYDKAIESYNKASEIKP